MRFTFFVVMLFDALCGLQGGKTRPAPFPGRSCKWQLNQALSLCSVSTGFLSVYFVVYWGHFCVNVS